MEGIKGMTEITKGLYEVLISPRLTKDEKKEAVRMNQYAVQDLRYVDQGIILREAPKLHEEDARMICDAIDNDNIEFLSDLSYES